MNRQRSEGRLETDAAQGLHSTPRSFKGEKVFLLCGFGRQSCRFEAPRYSPFVLAPEGWTLKRKQHGDSTMYGGLVRSTVHVGNS